MPSPPTGYLYDVYISAARDSGVTDAWLKEFLPLLTTWLKEVLSGKASVFWNQDPVRPDATWGSELNNALRASRCFVPILTPSFRRNASCMAEVRTFLARATRSGAQLIAPVILYGEAAPEELQQSVLADFREFNVVGEAFRRSDVYYRFQTRVRDLAERIGKMAAEAPPFDPKSPLYDPEAVAERLEMPTSRPRFVDPGS